MISFLAMHPLPYRLGVALGYRSMKKATFGNIIK